MKEIIFVTGTDTGVGKTVLTVSLLALMRKTGLNTIAVKPFCTGSRSDAKLLQQFQPDITDIKLINPFFFRAPLTPMYAAELEKISVPLVDVCDYLGKMAEKTDFLLVEGAGGLMSPLGPGYSLFDIIKKIPGKIIVVGPNKLGVLNHMQLIFFALDHVLVQGVIFVLMNFFKETLASKSNLYILQRLFGEDRVVQVPYLGRRIKEKHAVQKNLKNFKKVLALVLGKSKLLA